MKILCLAGQMGKRAVYSGFVRIEDAVKLFSTYDASLDVEKRAQRRPKRSRIPAILEYLEKHRKDWVFPSFTISFAGNTEFHPRQGRAGILNIDTSEPLMVHDGQHRFLGLQRAVEAFPELRNENISVLFLKRPSLEKAQQLFADLNKSAKTPSKSLLVVYDKDVVLNRITVQVSKECALFNDKMEKERTFVTKRSRLLVSMSALYQANERLLKYDRVMINTDPVRAAELAVHVWNLITAAIPEYSHIAKGNLSPAELREDSVLTNSVVLWAIGDAVAELKHQDNLTRAKLKPLSEINWSKRNRYWQGLIMLGTDIITRRQSREALSSYLQYKFGIIDSPPQPIFDEHGKLLPRL